MGSPLPPTIRTSDRGDHSRLGLDALSKAAERGSSASTGLGSRATARGSNIVSVKGDPHEPALQVVRRLCRAIVEGKFVVGLTTLLTVYVLLSEDLKVIYLDRPADLAVGFIAILCMVIFGLEILLSSIGKDDYFLGFFFWLDVVSTASLILDLPWISDAMNESDNGSMVSDAEKGRTARIGARSARVVRVIRLVRIAKLYKAVYESTNMRGKNKQGATQAKPGEDEDDEHAGSESRVGKKLSDVTTRRVIVLVLSMLTILPMFAADSTMKMPTSGQFGADQVWLALKDAGPPGSASHRAYEVTLLRYIYFHNWFSGNSQCPPGRQSPACPNAYTSHLYWVGFTGKNLSLVQEWAQRAQLTGEVVNEWAANISVQNDVYNYGDMPPVALSILESPWYQCNFDGAATSGERFGFSLLQNEIPGQISWTAKCWQDLRPTERKGLSASTLTLAEAEELRMDFWFDERPFTRSEAELSIGTTLFVCFVLCCAAMLFYNDVNQLVLYPVEEMITKVQAIKDNPLKAVDLAEKAYDKEVKNGDDPEDGNTPVKRNFQLKHRLEQAKRCLACYSSKPSEPMEMMILEKTIIKLGSLLALGFGEAGSQIIASNMSGSSFGVNVMVPGQRIDCVIGQACIQNFSVVTEVLQSRVMTFVNQVAEIVHGVVEEHHGAANKNNGDRFLLVWRCAQSDGAESVPDEDDPRLATFSELSVLAFSKIIGAIHRSSMLETYRHHPGLQNKLGSLYRVHLTCGVHCGWAIEGAVGSEYKIEASYLSPNVAVATNVEAATEIYNVCFLASEAVVNLCSKDMQNKCRLIDRVLVPGSKDPIGLYSIDLDWSGVKVEEQHSKRPTFFRARERMMARQLLEAEKKNKLRPEIVPSLFEGDPDIKAMRRGEQEVFTEHFRMGYQNYVEGEWQVARRFLEETCVMRDSIDGPSWALIRFMEKPFNFEAPSDWRGVHDLSSVLQGSGLGDLGEISKQLARVAQKRGFKGGPVMNTRAAAVRSFT